MKRSGQSTLELALLVTVIVAALFAMQVYLKRGIQGRLRTGVESIGEQYDPATTNTTTTVQHSSNVVTTSHTKPENVDVWLCPKWCADHTSCESACTHWVNMAQQTVTEIETVYDRTNRTETERMGGF